MYFSLASWVAGIQIVATVGIYSFTAFPSISGGDAGELAGVACAGGVAHPPGYPLWLMLARTTLALNQALGSALATSSFSSPGGLSAASLRSFRAVHKTAELQPGFESSSASLASADNFGLHKAPLLVVEPAVALNYLSALLSALAAAVLASTVRALAASGQLSPARKTSRGGGSGGSGGGGEEGDGVKEKKGEEEEEEEEEEGEEEGGGGGGGEEQEEGGDGGNRRSGQGVGGACASVLAATLYSFSGGVWEFSGQAEVFALNNVLVALVLRLTVSALSAAREHERVSQALVEEVECCEEAEKVEAEKTDSEKQQQQHEQFNANKKQHLGLLRTTTTTTTNTTSSTSKKKQKKQTQQEAQQEAAALRLLRLTAALALVSGLCLCNQHTSVLYVLPCAVSVVHAGRALLWGQHKTSASSASSSSSSSACSWRQALCVLVVYSVAALVGLSPYMYLPWAAHQKVLGSWGDQRTLDGFLTHLLRKEYGTFQLASELGEPQDMAKILSRLRMFFQRFSEESLAPYGPILAIVGATSLLLPRHRFHNGEGVGVSNHDRKKYTRGGSGGGGKIADKTADRNSFKEMNFEEKNGQKEKNKKNPKNKKAAIAEVGVESLTPSTSLSSSPPSPSSSSSPPSLTSWGYEWQPGGRLFVSLFVLYALFINALANLSSSPLHVNITARMWQQAYYIAYVCVGVGENHVFDFTARFASHIAARSSSSSSSSSLFNPTQRSSATTQHRNDKNPASTTSSVAANTWKGFAAALLLASSGLCALVPPGALFFAGWGQVGKGWAANNNRRNLAFVDFGRHLVDALPHNSILLANDDSNCNLPHYVLSCEPWRRPDVQFVRLPLITYEWWRRTQLHHYTNAASGTIDTNATNTFATAAASVADSRLSDKAGRGEHGKKKQKEKKRKKKGRKKKLTRPKEWGEEVVVVVKSSSSSSSSSGGGSGGHAESSGEVAWRVYGSADSRANDEEHARNTRVAMLEKKVEEESASNNGTLLSRQQQHQHQPTSAGAAGAAGKARAGTKAKVDVSTSLAFPGLRHHPHRTHDEGSFPLSEFLRMNLGGSVDSAHGVAQHGQQTARTINGVNKPARHVFVAGDWKSGDDSASQYRRVPAGLVDRVLAPWQPLDLKAFLKQGTSLLPSLLPLRLRLGLRALNGQSTKGHLWAFLDDDEADNVASSDADTDHDGGGGEGTCGFGSSAGFGGGRILKRAFNAITATTTTTAAVPALPTSSPPSLLPAPTSKSPPLSWPSESWLRSPLPHFLDSSPPLSSGSWDYVLAMKYYRGYFTAAQFLAERINELPAPTKPINITTSNLGKNVCQSPHPSPPSPSKQMGTDGGRADRDAEVGDGDGDDDDHPRLRLLRNALVAYGALFSDHLCSRDSASDFYCAPTLWRNAGVAAATLAADLGAVATATRKAYPKASLSNPHTGPSLSSSSSSSQSPASSLASTADSSGSDALKGEKKKRRRKKGTAAAAAAVTAVVEASDGDAGGGSEGEEGGGTRNGSGASTVVEAALRGLDEEARGANELMRRFWARFTDEAKAAEEAAAAAASAAAADAAATVGTKKKTKKGKFSNGVTKKKRLDRGSSQQQAGGPIEVVSAYKEMLPMLRAGVNPFDQNQIQNQNYQPLWLASWLDEFHKAQ